MSNTTGYTVPSYGSAASQKQRTAPAAVQTQKKQAEAAKTAATVAAVPKPEEFSVEKVRDAIVWAEILGEPRCRARHRRSSRMPR